MNWFPQMQSGTVAQFPTGSSRTWRAIRNTLESGEQITLPDSAGGQIEWQLSYTDLSDTERDKIAGLFSASSGSFMPFGFIDPLANLISWSQDLSKPDWQLGLITAAPGGGDPAGEQNACTLTNGSPGDQQVSQTVSLPGEYVACFSVWIRAASAVPVVLSRDGLQSTAIAGSDWKRAYVSGAGTPGGSSSTFSIGLPAGAAIQVWGMQVEAQPYASLYKATSAAAGFYEETYFASDELTVGNTGPGLSSCEVKLLSRV